MNDRINELMNKYLDGELKGKELMEFEELRNSEEYSKIFKAYTALDRVLKKTPNNLSADFTASVMGKIQKRVLARKGDQKFFYIMAGVFVLLILLILGFSITEVLNSTISGSSAVVNNSVYYLKKGVEYIAHLFPSKSLSVIGGLISLGMLISAWFFVDFRDKKI